MSGSPSKQDIQPKRFEPSVNPEDGSLLTAPLSTVVLASTDGLYTDLYNAAHGELDVTTAAQQGGEGDDQDDGTGGHGSGAASGGANIATSTKKEKMSSLSFAQRRHELAWRLVQHGRGLTHVAALTAANASTDFARATQVSSKALQHARTAWVQADEAQDALYFFHAQLFPARQSPHDVYGALDMQLIGKWLDMPTDLRLTVDRYQVSREARWSPKEVAERWQMAVRNKLLTGEIAWMKRQRQRQQQQQQQANQKNIGIKPLWNASLKGGIVRLTHGKPKMIMTGGGGGGGGGGGKIKNSNNSQPQQQPLYPIEALVTVLSTATPSEWSLLSIEVRAQPKTGESNHQLDASNRQRYNLHRLSALAMAREEARVRKLRIEQQQSNTTDAATTTTTTTAATSSDNNKDNEAALIKKEVNGDTKPSAISTTAFNTTKKLASTTAAVSATLVARPLEKLFEVAHTFALSWQLEILSAQAQALKRGNWTAGGRQTIVVTPVEFNEPNSSASAALAGTSAATAAAAAESSSNDQNNSNAAEIIGVVSMSFWRIDDQYGPPYMGDLFLPENNNSSSTPSSKTASSSSSLPATNQANNEISPPVTNQLTLSIRAEANVGIRVALSGGMPKSQLEQPHIQATLRELLDAASNPFALSASGALLAATRLCAEQKCHAIVNALQPPGSPSLLPPWMYLSVERTCISIFARLTYHGVPYDKEAPMVNLFRLTCDARTGGFVCSFARSSHLLRLLSCNDMHASESATMRILRLPPRARRRLAGANSIGRVIRDALDGLTRSMNALGHRTGVGGSWKDRDKMSASLRQRAIQSGCEDACLALIKSCGIAAMYGLSALALGVATGVTVTHDMAGDPLDKIDGISLLNAPPLSVLLDQQLIENERRRADGEKIKTSYINQQLFAIGCSATAEGLTLYPIDISVHLDTPISVPRRVESKVSKLSPLSSNGTTMNGMEPAAKRQKLSENGDAPSPPKLRELADEVERFAMLLLEAID